MKSYKAFIAAVAVIAVFGFGLKASAKVKCVPKIYAFGFSASFNDSIVYFTEIQEIDSAWIIEKKKFLISRENYSYQLKNYFYNIGKPHRTCIISFALDKKDIEKKYQKMRSKYMKANNFIVMDIEAKDFQFTPIKPDEYELQNYK